MQPANSTTNLAYYAVLENIDQIDSKDFEQYADSLSISERKRLQKMTSTSRKRQFILARHLLKQLIYLTTSKPANIEQLPSGQPVCKSQNLYCGISHSHHAVAVGYSALHPFGIDIEYHRPRVYERIVKYYFHDDEIQAFECLAEHEKANWFYRHWTAKEAYAKSKGEGLTQETLQTQLVDLKRYNQLDVVNYSDFTLSCVYSSAVRLYKWDI